MDSSPPASHQSSEYPESSNASEDGFLSWDRSRKSSAYRANRLNEEEDEGVANDVDNEFSSNEAAHLYQQQQHQIRSHSQQYNPKPSPDDESEESDERGIHGPTPFRPMAPREFALGNTLRRSRPTMPRATLPADATVARKGSHDGGTIASQSVTSASLASGSLSVDRSEIEVVHKMLQQEQQQEQQSMQRISENSGDSSTNESPEQTAGQNAGGDGIQQRAGEAAGEGHAFDRDNLQDGIHTADEEIMLETVRSLSSKVVKPASAADVAAVGKYSDSEDEKNQSFGLSESANELLIYERDPMESWRQSHTSAHIVEEDLKDIQDDDVKEGQAQDESIRKASESSHSSKSSASSVTGGYVKVDDDENDVDDISYDIGTEMGLHSRRSVEESDISETASEEEASKNSPARSNISSADNEILEAGNTLDRHQKDIDTRNEMDGQYIDHYLSSKKHESSHDNIQSRLPSKRPLGSDASDTNDDSTDHNMAQEESVSTLTAGDRFPLTSQTIAIADSADAQGASGAMTARFGKLLQECRDLTETCGDSARDSISSSHRDSTTKTSSSNLRSSTSQEEANSGDRKLSSTQLRSAAAMAAANSTNLQRRSYANPISQKKEIDTSDGRHLHISQLTVDPALQSSVMSTDFRGSTMSATGYREMKSSTFEGFLNNMDLKESQSSEEESSDEESSEDYEHVVRHTESFQVPLESPLGRREPRSETPAVARSVKSLVSELSLGVDAMYGETDEDNAFNKSGSLNDDLTAPFDPTRFLAALDPSLFEAGGESLENDNAPEQHSELPSQDDVGGIPTIETNEATTAAAAEEEEEEEEGEEETAHPTPPCTDEHIAVNKVSMEVASPARPSFPSYDSRASQISSEFSADDDGLLVGFGQRNVVRSITTKSSASSSTSSGAFSSGSDYSSSDESSSSGSSGTTSSSSDDDSDSSSGSLAKLARGGLQIQSSRDSVSELSFGGASALMALQSSRALQQIPKGPTLTEEKEAEEADNALSFSRPSTPSGSRHSSNDSGQQVQVMNDSCSRTDRRNSLIGEVDQLEKLDEVSESTASDFLDDVSSIGDDNNAVQNFLSAPTNEHELTSNMSEIWSSATSTGLKNIHVDKLLSDSLSTSSSPARNVNIVNIGQPLSSSSKSSPSPLQPVSPPKSFRSQGTPTSRDKMETKQDEKSSSTLSSLSPHFPIQSLTKDTANVRAISNINEALPDENAVVESGSQVSAKNDSPPSLGSSSSKRNSFTRWKSINSVKSQDSASAASSGSYYKGVLARAAAMNQVDDDSSQNDDVQLRSSSQNLENVSEESPSQDDAVQVLHDEGEHEDGTEQHKSKSKNSESLLESFPSQGSPEQVEGDIQPLTGSDELSKEAGEEFNTTEHDDVSSMSSVVSKARTSMRASFIESAQVIEEKVKEEPPKRDQLHRKQSMKSIFSYDGDNLYEDFPSEKDDDDVIRRNRSSASQAVSETVETDARRPWKTAAREEAAIPDESVLSAQTDSQRGSVSSGQDETERKDTRENHDDDETTEEGSLSDLFGSKEALKRMGLYSSTMGAEQNILSDDDSQHIASDDEDHVGTLTRMPNEDETNISASDRDKKVDSLRDSIRSSIQSIKEQFFGETRSNYSKSVASGQSIGSVKEMSINEQDEQTHPSLTSNDNSDESTSLQKSSEAEDIPSKSPARMLAETAREMSAALDHSLSTRSLGAQPVEDTSKPPKADQSLSSQSEDQDDKSISIDSLGDIESMVEVFKKKKVNKPAEQDDKSAMKVSFAGDADEEIGLPPKSLGDDGITSKNDASHKEEEDSQNSSDTSWWKVKLTKPRLICGSVTIAILIILFSSIGATVSKRNRTVPTSQPTASLTMVTANWVQVGGDLKGEMPGDQAGFSISASENGFSVVVGARRNGDSSDGTENRGAAQIFRFDELTGFYKPIWVYHGESKGDQCGFSVAMSKDGKRMAVGCPGSDTYGKNSGKVRLFMEEELSNTWIMVSEFYGEGSGDLFGASVSLSPEGTRLAVGAPYYTRNEVKRSGSAYAFREVTESDWQPVGDPMRGVVEESLFGWSVSLSPGGKFLAVGAPEAPEIDSSLNGGFVKVFSFEVDGSDWQNYGDPISNGVPGDRFGFSVSIAGDETRQRVAIGAPGNSANDMEGSGLASVYEHSGNGWSNAGDDLLGENQDENLGYAVSLTPAANKLVVGAPKKQWNGEVMGQVKVFNVGSGSLTPAGEKYGLNGEKFGVSVAISSNGKRFFGGATDANLVRVYQNIPVVNFNN